MPTTNIISTPNITGDVSSCTTNIVYLNGSGRPNVFIEENTGYATNNCTGQVDKFVSWEFSGFSSLLVGAIIGLGAMTILMHYLTKDSRRCY